VASRWFSTFWKKQVIAGSSGAATRLGMTTVIDRRYSFTP